jgi:small subunit ribosomal protein S17
MAKSFVGIVSSSANDKTIVISVDMKKTHPIYRKQFTRSAKFMAHDESNECKTGDKVRIIETRPLSAKKHFKLDKIIEKAKLTAKDLSSIEAEPEEVKKKIEKPSPKKQDTKNPEPKEKDAK